MKGKAIGFAAAVVLAVFALGPMSGCAVDVDHGHGRVGVGVGVHAGVDVDVGVDVDADPCGFDVIVDVIHGGLCCDTDFDGCCNACPDNCGAQ